MAKFFSESTRLQRIQSAFSKSRFGMRTSRKHRTDAIKETVGSLYSDNGSDRPMPINMLELGSTVLLSSLVTTTPTALVHVSDSLLRPNAKKFELALNRLIRHEVKLLDTLTQFAIGGIYSPRSVVKVGVTADYKRNRSMLYADPVSYDDYVIDMLAAQYEVRAFEGDSYWLPHDDVLDSGMFDNSKVEKVEPRTMGSGGVQLASSVSRYEAQNDDGAFYQMTNLVDLFFPREMLLATFMCHPGEGDSELGECVREVEWDGPYCGPYIGFGFGPVMDQLLHNPPVQLWRPLNTIINRGYRKLARQSNRQKSVLPVPSGDEKTVERLNTTDDGGAFRAEPGTQVPAEVNYGGIDQKNYGFIVDAINRLMEMGGNWSVLGGLAPQSGTVGQDTLLSENATKRVEKMRDVFQGKVVNILESLGFYLYEDMGREDLVAFEFAGMQIQDVFGPDDKLEPFYQYNISIEANSLRQQSPAERSGVLEKLFSTVMQMSGAQPSATGDMPNIRGYLEAQARYTDCKDVDQLITFAQPSQPGEDVVKPSGMPAVTTRRYVRENRSTATSRGQDAVRIQAAMGADPQPAEMAKLSMNGAA